MKLAAKEQISCNACPSIHNVYKSSYYVDFIIGQPYKLLISSLFVALSFE